MTKDSMRRVPEAVSPPPMEDVGDGEGFGPADFEIMIIRCKMEAVIAALEGMKDALPATFGLVVDVAPTHQILADRLAEFANTLVQGLFGE